MLPNTKYTSLRYTVGPCSLSIFLTDTLLNHLFTHFCFWLPRLLIATHWLSLIMGSGGCSLAVVWGLLAAAASPAAEHGLQREGTQSLWPTGLVTLRQSGIKPVSLALAGGFLTTGPPGKSPPKGLLCLLRKQPRKKVGGDPQLKSHQISYSVVKTWELSLQD